MKKKLRDKKDIKANGKEKQSIGPSPIQNNAHGFRISGNWNQQSKNLKTEFPKLTDEDLKLETGREDQLINRLSSKLQKGRLEVISILKKGQIEN